MNERNLDQPRIQLNDRIGESPMTMDMQQFFELSFWLAEELLDLESQYSSWATPNSKHPPYIETVSSRSTPKLGPSSK